jgi:hypothetical protein
MSDRQHESSPFARRERPSPATRGEDRRIGHEAGSCTVIARHGATPHPGGCPGRGARGERGEGRDCRLLPINRGSSGSTGTWIRDMTGPSCTSPARDCRRMGQTYLRPVLDGRQGKPPAPAGTTSAAPLSPTWGARRPPKHGDGAAAATAVQGNPRRKLERPSPQHERGQGAEHEPTASMCAASIAGASLPNSIPTMPRGCSSRWTSRRVGTVAGTREMHAEAGCAGWMRCAVVPAI